MFYLENTNEEQLERYIFAHKKRHPRGERFASKRLFRHLLFQRRKLLMKVVVVCIFVLETLSTNPKIIAWPRKVFEFLITSRAVLRG